MKQAKMTRPAAGFTMTELLVVMAIVSIMTSLAVPVYITKVEKAKVAAAQADEKQLAEAEDACYSIHGFYVPLQLLDDVPRSTAVSSTKSDSIDQESSIFLVDPGQTLDKLKQQAQISSDTADPRVTKLLQKWEGPFINFQRFYIGDSLSTDPNQIDTMYIRLDYPLDPWGNPYRFYSPLGVIGSNADSSNATDLKQTSFSNGQVTSNDQRFDRFAIVSYGPDGMPDKQGATTPDDIVYFFGALPGGNLNQ